MPLSNQPEPNRPIPRDDLRNTLLIIEKGKQYKDTAILKAILNVAFYMPSSNHMLYEYLQIYQGGLYERLLEDDAEYYLYDESDIAQAQEELYKRAYGDFKEAMWLLEQDFRGIINHRERDFYSDIIQPDYFTEEQRSIWNTFRKNILAAKNNSSEDSSQEAKHALEKLRTYLQGIYGPLIETAAETKLFRYEIEERQKAGERPAP